MTTPSQTYNPPMPVTSWRERIKITRTGFFAVVFILLGAWVLLSVPRNVAPDVTTLLTVDATGLVGIPVPTLGFSIMVALSYVICGIFVLVPMPAAWCAINRR